MDWRSKTPATATIRRHGPNAGLGPGPGPGIEWQMSHEPLPPGMRTLPVGLSTSLGRPSQSLWSRPMQTKALSATHERAVAAEPLPPGLSLPPLGSVTGLSDPPRGVFLPPSAKLPPPRIGVPPMAPPQTSKADDRIRVPPRLVANIAASSAPKTFQSQGPWTNPLVNPPALHDLQSLRAIEGGAKGAKRENALTPIDRVHTSSPTLPRFRESQQRPLFAPSLRQLSSPYQAYMAHLPTSGPPFLLPPGSHVPYYPVVREITLPSQSKTIQAPAYNISNSKVQSYFAQQSGSGRVQTTVPQQEPTDTLLLQTATVSQGLDTGSRSALEAVGTIVDKENRNRAKVGEHGCIAPSLQLLPPPTANVISRKQIPRKEFKVIKKRLQKRERRRQKAIVRNR